jgi:hypothetical protein
MNNTHSWLEHDQESWIPVQMSSQKGGQIIAKSVAGEQFDLDSGKEYTQVHAGTSTPFPCDFCSLFG